MTGYDGRLRSLEGRFGSGQCPLCGGAPAVDFITVAPGETLPPRPPCAACGAARKAFVVVLDRPTPESDAPDVTDMKPAPERRSKARTRRRRYCG